MMDKDDKLIYEKFKTLKEMWWGDHWKRAKVYYRGIDRAELDRMISKFKAGLPFYNVEDIMYSEEGTYMWTKIYDPEGDGGDPNDPEEEALNWIREDPEGYIVAFDASKIPEDKLYPDPELDGEAEVYLGGITKDMVIGIWRTSMGVKKEQVYP